MTLSKVLKYGILGVLPFLWACTPNTSTTPKKASSPTPQLTEAAYKADCLKLRNTPVGQLTTNQFAEIENCQRYDAAKVCLSEVFPQYQAAASKHLDEIKRNSLDDRFSSCLKLDSVYPFIPRKKQ
jgi:hypothetical protein